MFLFIFKHKYFAQYSIFPDFNENHPHSPAPPFSSNAPPSSYTATFSSSTAPPSSSTATSSSYTAPPSSSTAPPSSSTASPSSSTARPCPVLHIDCSLVDHALPILSQPPLWGGLATGTHLCRKVGSCS